MNRSICDVLASRSSQARALLGGAFRTPALACLLALLAAQPALAQAPVSEAPAPAVTPQGAPGYDFCPVGGNPVFSIINGVRISRYEPGAASDAIVPELDFPVAGNPNLNGLMVDRVRNRLLFVSRPSATTTAVWAYDAGNGGWYEAQSPFASPDFARAGMSMDGTGYLIASGSATPQVWGVTANATGFGYTAQLLGNLAYDIAPTDLGSGDIAIDGEGVGWLSAGQDLYRIDFGAGLQAVRQARPLLNGSPAQINWAGVAFADDGTLYVADNTAASRYYAYDPATGVLTPDGDAIANASRDLASCAFPVLAEADLSVVKTLAQINGAPAAPGAVAAPGDTLTYAIAIANSGGAVGTLFPGDVVETLPANTSMVTAGNDFTCTGSTCPNTAAVNVPAGGSVTLDFVVQVAASLPGGVTAIDNAVAVDGVDCAAAGNDCTETTPLGSALVTVDKTSDPAPGQPVAVGQTISYTLTTTITEGATGGVITLTDTLGAGLSFGAVTSAGAYTCNAASPLQCTLPAGTSPGTYPVVYTATVAPGASGTVANAVVPSGGDDPSCTTCTTQHPVQPSFGTCDASMYLSQAPSSTPPMTLIRFDTSSNPFVFEDVGDTAFNYNATAFNPADTYLYAIRTPGNTLVRVGGDGVALEVGPVANLPAGGSYFAGEIGPDGTYYVLNGNQLYRIDLATRIAAPLTISQALNVQDLAWHDGLIYTAVNNGSLFSIDPNSGAVTPIGATGAPAGAFGAMFGASNGVYGSNNNGGFYRFDTATGAATLIAGSPSSATNDGAKCVTTPLEFPADLSISKTDGSDTYVPGDDVVYSIVVGNAGPFGVSGATVDDPLPAGITTASWSCAATTPGASCGPPTSGSGAIEDVAVNLPANGSVTFTLTMAVPPDFTGELTNTATVTGPPEGSPDPDPGNNSDSDTDTAAVIRVNKSVDPASGSAVAVGDTLTYTLTVDVEGGATTADEVLTDTLGTGLTVGTVPAGCTSAGQVVTCTLPAGTAVGTHTFVYTAAVNADATTSVSNSVVPGAGICGTCTTTNPLAPMLTVDKSVDPASGTAVSIGDTLTYTLTVDVANAATTADEVLTDTLGTGLTVGTLPAGCASAGQVVTCTLAAGAAVGTHTFIYTATVNADAVTSVSNSVVPGTGVCGTCTTTNPVEPAITVNKSVDPASGTAVSVGDTLTYTLTVDVANAATTADEVLTDTHGAGLTVGTVPAGCTAAGQIVTCTLPAGSAIGSHSFVYTATVDADASTTVSNSVVPGTGVCGTCTTTNPVDPTLLVNKSVDPASGTAVSIGDTLTYTLTVEVANAATTAEEVLTDTLGAGLTVGTVPAGCTAAGQVVTCTLPAGTAVGTHTFVYTATVNADATTSVSNSVVPDTGVCGTCTTTNPVDPTLTVDKSVDPASGTPVSAGDTLTYTLSIEVANAATTAAEVLTDTLGDGLTVGTVPAGCTAAGQVVTCTLPAGSAIGTHSFAYTATVDADATTAVSNAVVPGTGACGTCSTTNPLTPTVTVDKSVDPGTGTAVSVGDTLTYTLTVNVANAVTTDPVVLTDTLGAGLSAGAIPAACSVAGQVISCTLAAGAAVGSHTFVYTATVDADASTAVGNSVTTNTGDCTSCTTSNPVVPRIAVNKTADPASGETVEAGAIVTYTVTVTVANAATTEALSLTDTLSGGQTLLPDSIQVPAGGSCSAVANGLQCSLAAGTAPGSHAFVYQVQVDADASGTIGNSVVASGGGGGEPDCQSCSTEHPIAEPVVEVIKSADPGGDAELHVGDTIRYTLTVTVAQAATTSELILDDTPSAGLTPGALPAGCSSNGSALRCVLPAGTVPGTYTFSYPATVNADAGGTVRNAVIAAGGGGEQNQPTCLSCDTEHRVVDIAQLRVVKTSSVREARIGDLVRYMVTVENVGATNVRDADLVDTAPAGFTYVDGSLSVVDGDNAATVSGYNPIRFEGLDIDAGETATLVYLMRIGAGVRQGVQINQAQAVSDGGGAISNVATAEVTLAADPLIDDSLILGTVFDDRDGDGWQDSAALTGVRVQGGFDASVYVPGSTTIDRGAGPQPVSDASAPLLHGIELGDIGARQSVADPAQRRQIVLRQRLTRPDFSGDFALASEQGVILRMDAAGATTIATEGEAAKGLNAAMPEVERRVAQGEGGYVVDYIIRNAGIDERGIPGVRIASVDGLLVETDQFGRYHLAGIPGGAWERGRNFILKVDPSTLPPGTEITTDNPLVRRITPGLPVRFDFGAKLPVELIEGGGRKVELQLGEVVFEPGSAQLRERHLPTVEQIAAKIVGYDGGEVVIAATGDSEALAFDRATAVRTALTAALPPQIATALEVSVRTAVDDPDSLVAGVGGGGTRLGTLLFDTDRDAIKAEFDPLLDRIAAHLEQAGGGTVSIAGHADVRGSDQHNLALGLRRAKAVFDAIAQRLSPETRKQVRVESSNGPAAPAGSGK